MTVKSLISLSWSEVSNGKPVLIFSRENLEFDMIIDSQVACNFGDVIRFKVDDKGIFTEKFSRKAEISQEMVGDCSSE